MIKRRTMDNEVSVRLAMENDLEDMIRLVALVFALEKDFQVDIDKQRWGLQQILQAGNDRCLWVAEKCGKVVGMCSAQLLISTAEGGWKAIIEDVAVDETCRHQGIGQKLLAEVADWAGRYGVRRLDLLADRNNDNGLCFYNHLGWKQTNLIALQRQL